jgi:hypothetical protein
VCFATASCATSHCSRRWSNQRVLITPPEYTISDEPTTSMASASSSTARAASTRLRGDAFAEEHDIGLEHAAAMSTPQHAERFQPPKLEIGIRRRFCATVSKNG